MPTLQEVMLGDVMRNPWDLTTRKIYADLLEDDGNPLHTVFRADQNTTVPDIKTLQPALEELLVNYWTEKVGWATGPADRKLVEDSICEMFEINGTPCPKRFIWVYSFLQGMLEGNKEQRVSREVYEDSSIQFYTFPSGTNADQWHSVKKKIYNHVNEAIWMPLRLGFFTYGAAIEVRGKLYKHSPTVKMLYRWHPWYRRGQYLACTLADKIYHTLAEGQGVEEYLRPLFQLAHEVHSWWTFEDRTVIVSERANKLQLTHNTDGTVSLDRMEFVDGWVVDKT